MMPKTGFEKESRQRRSQQRSGDIADASIVTRPVRPELEAHQSPLTTPSAKVSAKTLSTADAPITLPRFNIARRKVAHPEV